MLVLKVFMTSECSCICQDALLTFLAFPIPPNQIWKFYCLLISPVLTTLRTTVLSHSTIYDSLWPHWTVAHKASLWASSSPGKKTTICCHALLQGSLPNPRNWIQVSHHCRQFLFCLGHQGSTLILFVSSKYYFTYLFKHLFKNNVFLQKVI